jgi:hypothetical protein
MRYACSHISLALTDQELMGGGLAGDYVTAELSIALAFGH